MEGTGADVLCMVVGQRHLRVCLQFDASLLPLRLLPLGLALMYQIELHQDLQLVLAHYIIVGGTCRCPWEHVRICATQVTQGSFTSSCPPVLVKLPVSYQIRCARCVTTSQQDTVTSVVSGVRGSGTGQQQRL